MMIMSLTQPCRILIDFANPVIDNSTRVWLRMILVSLVDFDWTTCLKTIYFGYTSIITNPSACR